MCENQTQPLSEEEIEALAWLLKQYDGMELQDVPLATLISGARKLVKYHKEHNL